MRTSGRLVKPSEGRKWYSLKALPYFPSNFRVGKKGEELDVIEFLWHTEREKSSLKKYIERIPDDELLCRLEIPLQYGPDEDYDVRRIKDLDRYIIEELNFTHFQEDEGFFSVSKLCEIREAEETIDLIKLKVQELGLIITDIKYWLYNRISCIEQKYCPVCGTIALIDHQYCHLCGTEVGLRHVTWSHESAIPVRSEVTLLAK